MMKEFLPNEKGESWTEISKASWSSTVSRDHHEKCKPATYDTWEPQPAYYICSESVLNTTGVLHWFSEWDLFDCYTKLATKKSRLTDRKELQVVQLKIKARSSEI